MKKENDFTHVKDEEVQMVDISGKADSERKARAQALIKIPDKLDAILKDKDYTLAKGSVKQIAKIAGIMGAKKTADLIPLCHPLSLNKCDLSIETNEKNIIKITSETALTGKTGVEMEALTAVTTAALTFYDMCKSITQEMEIISIKLLHKSGGKTDYDAE